jgi:hypothetical protein
MKKIRLLSLCLLYGIICCNHPESDAKKINADEKSVSTPNDTLQVLTNEIPEAMDSIQNNSEIVFKEEEPSKRKHDKKSAGALNLTEESQRDPKSYIIPGFVKNTFVKEGNSYSFKRVVKNNEDTRVGCVEEDMNYLLHL